MSTPHLHSRKSQCDQARGHLPCAAGCDSPGPEYRSPASGILSAILRRYQQHGYHEEEESLDLVGDGQER